MGEIQLPHSYPINIFMQSLLKISKRIGHVSDTIGIDTFDKCDDREHFKSYKKQISYRYNSFGFRDEEWPADLSEVVWCVGDSFTVGIGQPHHETWPKVLEERIGKRCLNLGEDGCSNDSMALRVEEIVNTYKPRNIVIMWSFFSRRRIRDQNFQYNKADFGPEKDIKNFAKNFNAVDKLQTNIVHLLIPYAFIDSNVHDNQFITKTLERSGLFKEKSVEKIMTFKQLDFARDYYHFDIMTSKEIAKMVEEKILGLTNQPK